MARRNGTQRVKVLVADDHAVVRQGIRTCLEQGSRFEVVGEAATGEEAIQLACKLSPDVVLLDINMPHTDGIVVAEQLRQLAPHTKVLVLSVEENPRAIQQVVRCGAKGYLLKDAEPAELLRAIEAVASGETYFGHSVAQALQKIQNADNGSQKSTQQVRLTPREIQILKLVVSGLTNKQVAAHLKLSVRTVEAHRENMMRKLNAHNVADLTRYALAHGIVRLE